MDAKFQLLSNQVLHPSRQIAPHRTHPAPYGCADGIVHPTWCGAHIDRWRGQPHRERGSSPGLHLCRPARSRFGPGRGKRERRV